MPVVVDDPPSNTGPFAEYTSKEVLSRLTRYQEFVDAKYKESLPQNKLLASSQDNQNTCDDSDLGLAAGTIDWEGVVIENVLGEGGFSFIFKVSRNL